MIISRFGTKWTCRINERKLKPREHLNILATLYLVESALCIVQMKRKLVCNFIKDAVMSTYIFFVVKYLSILVQWHLESCGLQELTQTHFVGVGLEICWINCLVKKRKISLTTMNMVRYFLTHGHKIFKSKFL